MGLDRILNDFVKCTVALDSHLQVATYKFFYILSTKKEYCHHQADRRVFQSRLLFQVLKWLKQTPQYQNRWPDEL